MTVQTYVTLDANRRVTGCYPDDMFSADARPEGAVEIAGDELAKWLADQTQTIGADMTAQPGPAALPSQADYQNAIQQLVDQTAVEKQFNDGVTLASYVNSTIAAWSAQAKAFVAWRDQIWTYVYGELAKVQAGTRTQPTVAEFLTELPAITWPAS